MEEDEEDDKSKGIKINEKYMGIHQHNCLDQIITKTQRHGSNLQSTGPSVCITWGLNSQPFPPSAPCADVQPAGIGLLIPRKRNSFAPYLLHIYTQHA